VYSFGIFSTSEASSPGFEKQDKHFYVFNLQLNGDGEIFLSKFPLYGIAQVTLK